MRAADVLVLPRDVVLRPVDTLAADLRRQLQAEAGDLILSRHRFRNQSLLVGQDAADFLEQFRTPKTVVDAVIAHSARFGGSPEATLTEIIPLIARTRRLSMLVEHDSAAAHEVRAQLGPGKRIGGVRVQHCIHLLNDVEVYRATDRAGTACAVKLLRPKASDRAIERLDREATVLARLNGNGAPRLLTRGTWRGRRYQATEWCSGRNAAEAADRLNDTCGALSAPVLAVAQRVLAAYARLHAAGLLHGDVHPKNILIGDDGSATLVDFASSCSADPHSPLSALERMALVEYLEPECARHLARGVPLPAPTVAGEQFAIAALIYRLVTGAPYLDFSLVQEKCLEQVVTQAPRPFRELGLVGGETIERVLIKALSKPPAERFPTVAEFALHFERAARRVRVVRRLSGTGRRFLEHVTSRLSLHAGRIDPGLCQPPYCSLNHGASGLAYFFYRIAVLRGEPPMLATAAAWSTWADANLRNPLACACPELGITPQRVSAVSLHHRRPGIDFVRALVACAMADWNSCNGALAELGSAAAAPSQALDLVSGRAGVLLACAALLEVLPERPDVNRRAIEQHGRVLARTLGAALRGARVGDHAPFAGFGVAHGWAGTLFAALRWRQASGCTIPALRARLQELAQRARWKGSGASWPGIAAASRNSAPRTSWCNGGAGYVQLWSLADQAFPGAGFDRCAVGAANQLWAAVRAGGQANGSLCCGYAGQGFAMLTLYRRDGDRGWLAKAHAMLERAIARAEHAERRNSLYKGDAGIALLAEQLKRPASSHMPVFESEGWPRRA